jgi:hypothetical protein
MQPIPDCRADRLIYASNDKARCDRTTSLTRIGMLFIRKLENMEYSV